MPTLPPPYDRGVPIPVTVTRGSTRRRPLGLTIVAAVVAVALVLGTAAGLVFALRGGLESALDGGPSVDASQVQPREDVPMPATDPALALYYDQELAFEDCGNGNECADLIVPLDYAEPDGEKITVGVLRKPAAQEAIGSLLVNPGGPGASGIQYAEAGSAVWTPPVLDYYDLIGFDPRGVGQSTPLECLTTEQADELVAADPDPDTDAERDELDAQLREFGEGCLAESGDLARHVSTAEVVRDMDVLRHVLGEPRLDYFGASYGTSIGALYADTFPERVGRMVLDGAVDPALSSEEMTLQQAEAFEQALRAFLDDCLGRRDCPLTGSVDDAASQIRQLLVNVEEQPLPTDGDRELAVGNAQLGIWMPLYADFLWPELRRALSDALEEGDGTGLMTLSDAYTSRGTDGYTDNSLEILYAVNCLDDSTAIPTDEVPDYFDEFEEASPTFGRSFAYSLSTCGAWPIQSESTKRPLTAEGAPPIVVVGTTRDPATPLRWAEALADQLSSGRLVVRDGDGHTGYNQGNACVDRAIETFLLTGDAPADDTRC